MLSWNWLDNRIVQKSVMCISSGANSQKQTADTRFVAVHLEGRENSTP